MVAGRGLPYFAIRFLRGPLQGHTPTKARTLLPGKLHPKGKEQQQIRKGEGFADGAPAAQELRTHEAADGALDRVGNGIVNPAAHQRSRLNGRENLALSRRFIDRFSDVEAMMYIFLHDNAEVPSHIGRALFSGARLRDAMSFIRRLHESKNQMLSADIADLFSQLGAINTMRDHVVHWGAMEADDGTMITSNRLFSHAQRSLQEFPVSPEVLDTMTTDCDKAVAMLLIRQREFEEENTFTPVPKVELHQRKLAQLPWRYKSVQAIRQARKSQPMRGKPPTGPKPSRA